jgi:flagellar protein FlbD
VISLTRLNKKPVIVNAELIKYIEETPDTLITLISGDHFMVLETVQEVVDKAIDYAREIRGFRVV